MASLLRRAAGPTLLGWPTVALFSVLSIGIALMSSPVGAIDLADRLLWAVVGAVTQVPVVIVVLVGAWIVGDGRDRRSAVSRLAVVVCGGLVRGGGLYVGAELLGLPGSIDLWSRLLGAAVTTVLWMLLISLVLATLESFRLSYGAIFEREVAVAAAAIDDTETTRRIGDEVAAWGTPLARRLDDLRRNVETEAVAEAAEAIRTLVRTRLRPLSHRLWFSDSAQPPRSRFGPVLAEAWRARHLLRATPLVFFAAVLSAGILVRSEPADSVPTLVLVAAVTALSWGGATALGRKCRPVVVNAIGVPLTALAIGFVPGVVSRWSSGQPLASTFDETAVMSSVSLGFVLVMSALGMARVSSDDRAALIRLLRRDREELDRAIAVRARQRREREVGVYLHNHVKSQLTAHALRLGNAAEGSDIDMDSTVDALIHTLTRPLPDEVITGRTDGISRLREIAEAWEGIAEVKIDSGDIERAGEGALAIVVDVVAEAVANAVRAGRATHIDVVASLSTSPSTPTDATLLTLDIRDNGRPSPDPDAGGSGLGSAWLDSIAPGMWRRHSMADGTTLEVRIPVVSA